LGHEPDMFTKGKEHLERDDLLLKAKTADLKSKADKYARFM